ncbi:MAG: DNA polymerase III subunit beta [Clostridia bacterium]|nr:DNA polymerase III subunit beta [Clostridia bacterium]
MRAIFEKQTLLSALSAAAGISQTKNTFTAADGLLFECPPDPKFGDYDTGRDDLCRISAFDLEKGLRATIPCTVIEKGMAVLNTVKILQIVRALPDGEITVDVNERGRALVSGGSFRFEITASPGSEFPSMPMFVGDRIWQIPQRTLKFLLTKTVYAVAQNDPRAAFNGALVRIRDGVLTVVGSDGFRISTAKAALTDENGTVPDAEMLIPGRFLGELIRLLRDTDDTVPMLLGRKHVIFTVDNLRFFTRLMDTEYVPYEQFFPQSAKTDVIVSRERLLEAVESVSVVTEDRLGGSGRTYIKLDFTGDGIALSSVSSGGSVSGTIPADVTGQDITIAFTCRYLLDALKAVPEDCETLRIRLNSPGTGILIEPADGDTFADFILPYRIGK